MLATYQVAIALGVVTLACWLSAGLTALFGSARNVLYPDPVIGKVALGLNVLGSASALALAVIMLAAG